jgi:simple sugar transport system substrate-binding protein
MLKDEFVIFRAPLNDNTGKVVIPGGTLQKQTDIVLEQMNYLVAGVVRKV